MSEPFSEVRLDLKQIDLSIAREPERSVFERTLGTYNRPHSEAEISEGTARLRDVMGGAEVQFDPSAQRRFAGDQTLPRTRYSSLADATGFDDRTLLREISAYLTGSTYPGLVTLFDTDGANSLELLGTLADITQANDSALDLSTPSLLIGVRPLVGDAALREAYGESHQYCVQIPYRVTTRVVADVLDLRRPAARTWLVDQFHRTVRLGGEQFPLLLGRQGPRDFAELLPSLLDQWLGGGWTTANMTGLFAREAGCRGLVYPSARSDAYVELDDGSVLDSSGWCFVSYEEAPEMEVNVQVSLASDDWPTEVGWSPAEFTWVKEFIPLLGTRIDHVRDGAGAGSFAVVGVAAYNWATYRMSSVTRVLHALDPDRGPQVSSELAYLTLYSPAEAVAWLASLMFRALLGDTNAFGELSAAAARAHSDFEREALEGAVSVASKAPIFFRATGAYAQALGISRDS